MIRCPKCGHVFNEQENKRESAPIGYYWYAVDLGNTGEYFICDICKGEHTAGLIRDEALAPCITTKEVAYSQPHRISCICYDCAQRAGIREGM